MDNEDLPAIGTRVDGLPYVGFNQLRSFHAVALTGSVTAAARLLHVGQPTVTAQLRQLEARYKVELAHRHPTGMRLTDVGKELFTLTESIFQAQAQAVDLLTGEKGALHGTLRVGSVAPHFVMPALSAFTSAHPQVKIDVTFDDSATIAAMVADYDADVGVIGHPGLDSRYLSVPLSRQRMGVMVPPDHEWADRDEVGLEELACARLVMRKGGSTSRRVLEEAFRASGLQPNIVLEVDREGALEAVRAGLGVTVVTTAEVRGQEKLRMAPLAGAELYTDAHVICLDLRRGAPLVRAFLEVVAHVRSQRSQR